MAPAPAVPAAIHDVPSRLLSTAYDPAPAAAAHVTSVEVGEVADAATPVGVSGGSTASKKIPLTTALMPASLTTRNWTLPCRSQVA